ncbi:hypothetical protein QCA50_003833 [Cerrena zonata]|uniref:Ribosomal lysine N-methyltransferase 4 n=1 Tax=Cerrena zonata TaxID=2478898 RepID=A0AAW0GM51_9APHY
MAQSDSTPAFLTWFTEHDGIMDTSSMLLAIVPGHGRAAIASRDIPEGYTLFEIPRGLTLSLRTSSLPEKFGISAWRKHGLHQGWAGLILCMMWEESLQELSNWSGYLSILPSSFDTPMFWSEEELAELKGTAVVDKIGRGDAERDYHEKVTPAIRSRLDLFPPNVHDKFFSVEQYHVMGSRILSRSFRVEPWGKEEGEEDDEEEDGAEANTSTDNAMDVDELVERRHPEKGQLEPEEASDEEDDEIEDTADIAMVPMADMLNARFESENAKLFYEEEVLKMITTKEIQAGEQIWNTYGDLPNSDLLRRYGHVDVVTLRPPLAGEGNPADVVEIRADLVVETVSSRAQGNVQNRVDWWLERADDDAFVAESDCEVPKELISLVHLLLLPEVDWLKLHAQEKLPKGKLTPEVLPVVIEVLQRRLTAYPTSLEEDVTLLEDPTLSTNKRNAIVVRVGEKRILQCTLERIQALQQSAGGNPDKKRKDTGPTRHPGGNKKSRR